MSDGATSLIALTDSKGNAWDDATPIGITATSSGYTMITSEVGKKGTTYEEVSVGSDGEVAKKGSSLTSLQLIGKEESYSADLNQDDEIGLVPSGTRSDYGEGSTEVYVISGVGHGLLSDGAVSLIALTDSKGNAWDDATPIGITATSSGYTMITSEVGKKGTTYEEVSVGSDGEVAKKGSSLTSLQLIGKEESYSADLNQDDEIGLVPSGTRSDYGEGSTEVYVISGVGHGILADGATSLIALTDSKGNACLLYTSPSPRDS